ncbi:TonB-dependent receptor [Aestuariicella hydrocarbonica]|uniref:TonB-dependent receptor n=1 Tax=Pseudomaricurvus hydrocarbonicus TaxID=1470433 RepID=A0A9E5JY22_9GAMM|nr:TonB-dependent receptor [Aestuariicella hydrocarbonica]
MLPAFTVVAAEEPGPQRDAGSQYSMVLEEVVVTARRKFESLQDVPQTVNAVSADTFQDLNILNFEDMESVVPGISLESGSNGYTTSASMRGVNFTVESNVSPTVEFYLNDAPVESNHIFTQVFDVSQVEVLRGPQGTLRGRSAPSGAITVTTRDVNLNEFEGYLNGTATDQGASNYQGAINIPLIEGKAGLRLAAVLDENEVNQVNSLFNDADPDSDIKGFRATLGFEPLENLDGKLMFQRISKDLLSFTQFSGFNDATRLPHHDFGVIQAKDRQGLAATPSKIKNVNEATTLNLNWLVGGHVLSYVGSLSDYKTDSNAPSDEINYIYSSAGGSFPFLGSQAIQQDEWFQQLDISRKQDSHELRISLEEPYKDFIDYTFGVFYQSQDVVVDLDSNTILSADFSSFLAFANPNPDTGAYIWTNSIHRPNGAEEISAFANLTLYPAVDTEVSAGIRQIHSRSWSRTEAAGLLLNDLEQDSDELIWNLSLSHRFNDAFMSYLNVGTAFRPAPMDTLGINPLPNPDTNMEKLVGARENETSISYEAGLKLDFMGGRGRINAAYYYQSFENYLYYSPSTQYFGTNGVEAFRFTSNADAVVQGIDLDASFQILPNWVVSGVFSWSNSELKDPVPCNDGNLDGQPDFLPASLNASYQVAVCDTGASASSTPDWTATIRTEYVTGFNDTMEGYIRGMYSYYPENDNKHLRTQIDNYGLLNLFVGVRDIEGRWDIQLFAKNALDEQTVTTLEDLQYGAGGTLANYLGDSGYYSTQVNAQREIGVNVRYNFGVN